MPHFTSPYPSSVPAPRVSVPPRAARQAHGRSGARRNACPAGAVIFAQESLIRIRDEAWPLLLRHWEEIALNKATTPLDPDWRTYELLERAGVLHVTTARADGELIGYVSWLVAPNLHYRTLIVAQDDIFFLAPEHRRGRAGILLLRAAHRAMIAAGATKIIHHHKVHMDVGPVFKSMGFALIEHVWAKVL